MDTEKLKELLTGITDTIKPESGQDCVDAAGFILATGLAYADAVNTYSELESTIDAVDASALACGLTWLVSTKIEDATILSRFLDTIEKLLTKKAASLDNPEQVADISIQLCGFLAKHAAAAIIAAGGHTPEEVADLQPKLAGTIQGNCVYVLMQSTLRYYANYAASLNDQPQESEAHEPGYPNPSPGSSWPTKLDLV